MTEPTPPPVEGDDFLDGTCDLDAAMAPETADDQSDALVLFADVDFLDPASVEARRAEWVDLAAAGDDP